MLETNDVDVDLFTPATGASLATIFSKIHDQNEENTSLKYVPQAPIPPIQYKISEADKMSKTTPNTQCVFATSVSAYEWVDNKYNLQDNLGVALVRAAKDNIHHLILYTSEKNTLSLTTISPSLVVNVKKHMSLSYYDDYKKYWLICASVHKITNIVEHLKNLKVNINHLTVEDITGEAEIEKTNDSFKQHLKENLESDTDSSNNRKNKESILQRMATMGQSVLPTNKTTAAQSSDSSDTNEYDHLPLPRHKHTKSLTKRYTVEKNASTEMYNKSNKNLPHMIQIGETSSITTSEKQDFVPKNIIDNTSDLLNLDFNNYNNMNNFISEQRISNSELRININRLSDKVEQLFDNVSFRGLETSNQQNEIVNKLLKEYETKIMTYENFIKSKGFDCNVVVGINGNDGAGGSLKQTGDQFNEEMKPISDKQNGEVKEMKKLTESKTPDNKNENDDILLKEIHSLKRDLHIKNDMLSKINENIQTLTDNTNKDEFINKLKIIMNCTFQRISANFNDEDTYSGTMVKNIVAKAIKKTTMESINDRF